MSARFHRFERTVHTSYEWLDAVAAHIGGERRDAYHALHAVLGALRDRLPADVAADLSAQMPLLVRGVFFDGHEPANAPVRTAGADDFVAAVRCALAPAPGIDARDAIDAVLEALTTNIDRRVLDEIGPLLPAQFRARLQAARAAPSTERLHAEA
jgi:uncharacterized protein (DUF2267 family)